MLTADVDQWGDTHSNSQVIESFTDGILLAPFSSTTFSSTTNALECIGKCIGKRIGRTSEPISVTLAGHDEAGYEAQCEANALVGG